MSKHHHFQMMPKMFALKKYPPMSFTSRNDSAACVSRWLSVYSLILVIIYNEALAKSGPLCYSCDYRQ